ncbi:MAG: Abi family protein [Actinomycetales bacterium]|nr:Abi family protein [Actinomycetales bacterium]
MPTTKATSQRFSNWLNHIRYVRNTCAHHSRLWKP